MYKKLLLPAIFGILAFSSCSDDDDSNPPPGNDSYMDTTAGATRDFSQTVNNPPTAPTTYRLTTSNQDTLAGGNSYRIFVNNNGPNQYFRNSGNDYYSFADVGGALQGVLLENLYLKTNVAVGNSWNMTFNNISVPGITGTVSGTLTNKIEEKGIGHTAAGIAYSDVIRVSSTVNNVSVTVEIIPGTPTTIPVPADQLYTNIQSYYAPTVGLVENQAIISLDIDLMGFQYQDSSNVSTLLTASNIP